MIALAEITLQIDNTYLVYVEHEDGTSSTIGNLPDMNAARSKLNELIDLHLRSDEPLSGPMPRS